MLRAMFRGLIVHRVRLAMTALAIALGVGFMSGSFVFTSTLTHSLDSLISQASTGTDVVVQHSSPAGGFGAGSGAPQPIPASILASVRAQPGVAAADGGVSGHAQLLGRSGKKLPGQFTIATSWPADAAFQATYTRRTGSPPAAPDQVMIDRASARAGHFAVGDTIKVIIGGQARAFTISGTAGYGSADSFAGGSLVIFSLPTAERLFGQPGSYDSIDVKAAAGVSAQQLRDQIARILPPGITAVTAASAAATQASQLNSQLSILTKFFLVFAGVALFVGAFVIWNTFSIMIGQRTRELALLRALGAGRRQVFRSVLAEAAIVGTVASLGGAGLGIALSKGLVALLSSFGLSLPVTGLVVPPGQLALAAATGLAVTLIAAVAPAYRATSVAPVQALRDAVPSPVVFSGRRLTAGLAVTVAGVVLVLAGLFAGGGLALTGAGAVLSFVGVTVLGPLAARPLAWVIGSPLTRLPGRTGALARGNTMRNPKRTSATAAALMIGLTLIVAAAVMVDSSRTMLGRQIAVASKTTFYVQATSSDIGLTAQLAPVLAAQPGVRAVTEVRATDATVAGAAHRNVDGVDPAAIGTFTDLGMKSGTVAALSTGGLLVSQAAATGHGWRVGDQVRIQFGSFGTSTLRIGGVFANVGPLSDYLVSNMTFTADSGSRVDSLDLVRASAAARAPIQRALAGYPGAQLMDEAAFTKSRGAVLKNLLNLITAMLVLAIIIALLGIVNTLALSVVERIRELGLLRALGMRRGQLAQMVAAESLIIAVIGAALGSVLGLALGAALAEAFTRSQQATVAVPVGQIVAYIVATALAGVLAAIAPARRAARLNVLEAIAAE
ncbi:MAG TPA: FtsX-like permease family protein [Streptosporangiaceae bacterium]